MQGLVDTDFHWNVLYSFERVVERACKMGREEEAGQNYTTESYYDKQSGLLHQLSRIFLKNYL
jgi:hypothetical protein